MTDCLFCKMVSGVIKPDVVYEDDSVLAFRDINPQAPVHILIIPKRHI
ncbi:MAG: HIT domain-containing protein, partial [Methylococcales bacterium]|nr:HIT domain-containing protein [Methylococcales bacterium]